MTEIGTVIDGKYEVLREIGRGGMSVVYLAMDTHLNKQWAVKEIRKKGSGKNDEIVVNSLLAEANMMKRLDHPSLPRIVDIIDNGVTIYVVMDYICCSSYGRPRSATYASSQYKALLRNNGLPDIRFHDLRHTYASMLLSEELSVKAVSNTLGHAKSIVTVDVYGDKARIIGDGTDAMRPTLEYVLPTEYITSREVGVLKKRVVYDSSIGFPEELADDIMECLLHKCA